MGTGVFKNTVLHLRSRISIVAILLTAASFSNARSIVEHSVRAKFNPTALQDQCPAEEDYLSSQANLEYDTLLTNTPSKFTPNVMIANEAPITKEVQPGLRITDRPTLIQVLENTFEGVTLAPQAAQLATCNDTLCVLKTIFGSEEAAKRLLFISIQTGFTLSVSPSHTQAVLETVTENGVRTTRQRQGSSVWALNELRRMTNTAKILPQIRAKLTSPVTIYRVGVPSKAAAEASSESWIHFFQGAFENDESPWDGAENAIYTDKVFVHEYCHLIDYEGRYEPQNGNAIKSYKSLLPKYQPRLGPGWGVKGNGAQFVTDYSQKSHAEDFAESCAYFILAPKVLAERAPAKYAAMKDIVFSGRDFTGAFWNRPLFPEVSELLTSAATENQCESDLMNHLGDIRLLGDGRAYEVGERTATSVTTWSHSHWYLTSVILKNSRDAILDESLKTLENSPTFCARGGERALRLRAPLICAEAQKKIEKVAKRSLSELNTLASECVKTERNLTSSCVDSKMASKIASETTDTLMVALAKRYETLPMAISLQSEAVKSVSVLDWLGACLSPVASVSPDAAGRTLYQLKGPTVTNPGALVLSADNPQNLSSVQGACLGEIRNLLKRQNFTLPTWSAAESVEFYKYLPGFEKLLGGIESVILSASLKRTCGVNGNAACSEADVTKRYRGWEAVYRPAADSAPATPGVLPELLRITQNLR